MLAVFSEYAFFLISSILDVIVFGKFVQVKLKLNKYDLLIIVAFSVFNCLVGSIDPGFIKIIITNLNTIIMLKLLYKESLSKTIIGAIFILLGYIVGELVYILVASPFSNMWEKNDILNNIIIDTIMYSSYYLFYCIAPIVALINNILKWVNQKKAIDLIIKFVIMIVTLLLIMSPLSYKTMNQEVLFILFGVVIAILVFIVGYFKEKSDNNRLTIKFDQLLEYVKDYEKEVVAKSKVQHEHKNQLGVIAGMIPKSNKNLNDLRDYVNKQLNEAEKLDNSIWLEKIANLPSGGIKGLVYLKIKKMLDNNIIVHIEIDNKLKGKNKWLTINNNLEDYTRIIGVYLDNAIDAASQAKEKQIIIEFIDNKDSIEFDISNTYIGDIEFDKIDNEKYSTKGDSRGYGLSIVKDIMDNNNLFSQKRELNGKFFVEKLYIKKQD